MTRTHAMNRRELLKTAAGAAVLAGSLGRGAAFAATADQKTVSLRGDLPTRPFGKTGHTLPVLGHGGSAMSTTFWEKYRFPQDLSMPPLEARVAMVRKAYDLGVRYFDTARVYGESERIMGQALGDVRDDVYIATKLAVMRPEDARASVEKSLTELGMDSIDCMQIHSPTIERTGYDGAMKVHAELVKMRDEGLFRFIGLTTHVVYEDVHRLISTGGFDQVLLARGYFPIGLDSVHSHRNLEWREMCVAKAHELGMGIVIMKVLGAVVFGHSSRTLVADYPEEQRAKLPAAAIRWVLEDERVSMLNVGMTFPEDVERNVRVLRESAALTGEDRTLLADFSRRAFESEFVKAQRVT
jgi:predicted aldo/keto reductase-like oxidoreductase